MTKLGTVVVMISVVGAVMVIGFVIVIGTVIGVVTVTFDGQTEVVVIVVLLPWQLGQGFSKVKTLVAVVVITSVVM